MSLLCHFISLVLLLVPNSPLLLSNSPLLVSNELPKQERKEELLKKKEGKERKKKEKKEFGTTEDRSSHAEVFVTSQSSSFFSSSFSSVTEVLSDHEYIKRRLLEHKIQPFFLYLLHTHSLSLNLSLYFLLAHTLSLCSSNQKNLIQSKSNQIQEEKKEKMKPIAGSILLVAFLSLALLSLIDSSESTPSNDDVSNMIEALKVLEQYDRLSRPRYVSRLFNQTLIHSISIFRSYYIDTFFIHF